MVRKALELSLSVGEMKLPAALLIIMSGRLPSELVNSLATLLTAVGSRTSN